MVYTKGFLQQMELFVVMALLLRISLDQSSSKQIEQL